MSLLPRIQKRKVLSNFSTFGIGGEARFFVEIKTIDEMAAIRQYINRENLPFLVIGKGSNLLFDDRGFEGLVILNLIDFMKFDEGLLHVGTGYSFSLLGAQMSRKGFSGLEFASGIPGSVGGAIYMNAGIGEMETQDRLTAVEFIDKEGKLVEMKKEELKFSYRFSSFQQMDGIIVSGKFHLEKQSDAQKKQRSFVAYRIKTQPYGEKSAGCVFRNLDTITAGELIDKCGLKGKSVGGASISTTHANFIINKGNAKAQDVLKLISEIKYKIKEKTGKELKMEIKYVPYELSS